MLSVDDTKKIVDKMCMEMFGKDFCDKYHQPQIGRWYFCPTFIFDLYLLSWLRPDAGLPDQAYGGNLPHRSW